MNLNKQYTLFDFIDLIRKRKWFIVFPTLFLTIIAGIISLILPKVWEIDAIIEPSNFTVTTQLGEFKTVFVTSPEQIVEEINRDSYLIGISSDLNIDKIKIPSIKAEALKNTNLVRIYSRYNDIDLTKKVLISLFNQLKKMLDIQINVQIKEIDTKIESYKNQIEQKKLEIENTKEDIKMEQINKRKIHQQINTSKNKIEISNKRDANLIAEMNEVKTRIQEIEKRQNQALEKNDPNNAISMLLYANEVQLNFRYYSTLDEKLSNEDVLRANLKLDVNKSEEDSKSVDSQIAKLNTEIEKIQYEITEMEKKTEFFAEKKNIFSPTRIIKEPQKSLFQFSPRIKLNVVIVFLFSLVLSTFLVFFLEYYNKNKKKHNNE